jgi:hypothetical protein
VAAGKHAPVGLEIEQDLEFQERQWLFERAGTAVLCALLAAAALGLFGGGCLTKATATDAAGAVTVAYPRFARAQSPVRWRVEVRPEPSTEDGDLRLWLSSGCFERLSLEHVTPEPRATEAGASGLTFVFDGDGSGSAAVVHFVFQAHRAGKVAGAIGRNPEDAARVRLFIYP